MLKKFNLILSLIICSMLNLYAVNQGTIDAALKIRYSFDNTEEGTSIVNDDTQNGYEATLSNGATIVPYGGNEGTLFLGPNNGFLDLGSRFGSDLLSTLTDFTISAFVYIPEGSDLTTNGNFVFSFGNSDNMASTKNGCMFFSCKTTRYAISKKHWEGEQGVQTGNAISKGNWKHVAITYEKSTSASNVFIDGTVVASSSSISLSPNDLGSTGYNYLGKSSYALNGDSYLQNAMIDEFRIYNVALADTTVKALSDELPTYQKGLIKYQIYRTLGLLGLQDGQDVVESIDLPASKDGISISWSSSNTSVISTEGVVVRPSGNGVPEIVKLTALGSIDGVSIEREFNVTVLPDYSDEDIVQLDTDSIIISGNIDNLRSSLNLPTLGNFGSDIQWMSSLPSLLDSSGQLTYLPENGSGKTKVVLTATVSKGNSSKTTSFDIYVAEKEPYSAYLFAYFTGNYDGQEAIRFALSNDGKNYLALNDNNPIINSADISSTGGVRDPHILRGEDGKTFYMVVTDMKAANGWDSNRAMVLLKSTDLINWTSSIVNIQTTYPSFSDVKRVWAPQTIYDKSVGKYMLYWSMKLGSSGIDKVYYAYANADFTALESEPKLLFENPSGTATIDSDIIEKGGKYYFFMKTENAGNGIKKAVAESLKGPYALEDHFLQQTDKDVEGGCVFRLIDTDTYILMYDVYKDGKYQFTESTDLDNFEIVDDETSMNFTPRHGTTITITQEEAVRLAREWGVASDIAITGTSSDSVKLINSSFDKTSKSIYLAVKKGTDITDFDPELIATAGCVVTPEGTQDFSNGAVSYTASIDGIGSETYSVEVEVNGNPVIEGYYADPDILYSQKTGKFYMYPTSDSFTGWSGTYFKAFSSTDLVNWKDEGVILDLKTDVSWASARAWAPCIIEREIDGEYKYFYYFTAETKIGVAVSNSPTGPFVDSGSALISNRPSGVSSGQQIDADVFKDPVSGKYFLYWGNTYMAVSELNDDMVSINPSTTKVITPYDYKEGTYVVYREGKYYFFWSDGDTRNVDYRVRYGYSSSPTGPITTPDNNIILSKNVSLGIYATGHNSVIQIPERDEWYIVYHRFTRPEGINMSGDAAGYFREICIDTLKFNSDGTIKTVVPTVEGIEPVDLSDDHNSVKYSLKTQDNGELVSVQLFDIAGVKMDIHHHVNPGVYILKKIYGNGNFEYEKILINNVSDLRRLYQGLY